MTSDTLQDRSRDPLPPQSPDAPAAHAAHWSALLTDAREVGARTEEEFRQSLQAWWDDLEASGLPRALLDLPDAFRTVRFWSEVKHCEAHLGRLHTLLTRLRARELSFEEAMEQAALLFQRDEERLADWNRSLAAMRDLLRWIPIFERQHAYIMGSAPTDDLEVEELRRRLWAQMEQPHLFLEASARQGFHEDFLDFRRRYAERYCALHQEAVEIVGRSELLESKIDSIALRNLELLSNLQHTNRSHLNRARATGEWVGHRQCDLPVGHILEHHPLCYCNFQPAVGARVAESVAELNATVKEGLAYFRGLLRRFKPVLLRELQSATADRQVVAQIAALLGDGRLPVLKPRTIDALNEIIRDNPREFLTLVRPPRR